jgi:hypothetical protein
MEHCPNYRWESPCNQILRLRLTLISKGFVGSGSNFSYNIGYGGLNRNPLFTETIYSPLFTKQDKTKISTYDRVSRDPTMIIQMIIRNDSDTSKTEPYRGEFGSATYLSCLVPTNFTSGSRLPGSSQLLSAETIVRSIGTRHCLSLGAWLLPLTSIMWFL